MYNLILLCSAQKRKRKVNLNTIFKENVKRIRKDAEASSSSGNKLMHAIIHFICTTVHVNYSRCHIGFIWVPEINLYIITYNVHACTMYTCT